MKLRREPAIATWFLSLFCSNSEYESVIGDLMEQYQQGRGRLWYWRQVIALSLRGLYARVARRPLTPTHRLPMGLIFGAILLITALATTLLSDIGQIFGIAILGGLFVGIFKFMHGDGHEQPPLDAPRIVRIDSSRIPIGGSTGAGILILILFTAVLHDLPNLRVLAVPGLLAGLVFAGVLRLWRKWHPRTTSRDWLSIKR
jgi:hypothetical protein